MVIVSKWGLPDSGWLWIRYSGKHGWWKGTWNCDRRRGYRRCGGRVDKLELLTLDRINVTILRWLWVMLPVWKSLSIDCSYHQRKDWSYWLRNKTSWYNPLNLMQSIVQLQSLWAQRPPFFMAIESCELLLCTTSNECVVLHPHIWCQVFSRMKGGQLQGSRPEHTIKNTPKVTPEHGSVMPYMPSWCCMAFVGRALLLVLVGLFFSAVGSCSFFIIGSCGRNVLVFIIGSCGDNRIFTQDKLTWPLWAVCPKLEWMVLKTGSKAHHLVNDYWVTHCCCHFWEAPAFCCPWQGTAKSQPYFAI